MIVVDTNVVSELMRPEPSEEVVRWVRDLQESDVYTTSITVAEIGYGVERLPDGRRKNILRATGSEVFATFRAHVLPFDAEAAGQYGPIVCLRERMGLPIDGFDAQIAAICRSRGATLATRNLSDFQGTLVDVIAPWQPEGACG